MDNFFEELEKPKTKDEILLEKKAKFYKPVDDALLKQSGFELNKVYNADCLEIMRSMPDKCIDLVITDPPYGLERFKKGGSHVNKYGTEKQEWNNVKPTKELFDEIFRISKNQIIFGMNNFTLPETEYFIVWKKSNAFDFSFAMCELAWTNIKKPAKIFEYLHVQNNEKREHPTQKPVALFSWILKNYAKPNDIIFDPFAGSGTTAISCMQMDHPYILVEKEKDYYDIIMKRIDKQKKDLVALF